MYGRPYGRSLCHAWASGPAFLLPRLLLGLLPGPDGWERTALSPWTEGLREAGPLALRVPTPLGTLSISADGEHLRADVPAGMTLLVEDREHTGPVRITLPTDQDRRDRG